MAFRPSGACGLMGHTGGDEVLGLETLLLGLLLTKPSLQAYHPLAGEGLGFPLQSPWADCGYQLSPESHPLKSLFIYCLFSLCFSVPFFLMVSPDFLFFPS